MNGLQLLKAYRKLKFLVVDDFDNFRMSIKQMLRAFGVEHVTTANNGEDAISKFNYDNFDIVICDFNMGDGKNGQQVLEYLRHHKKIKRSSIFILITAETSKDIVMGTREYQPDCYITKPITKAVLQKRLDALIDQRETLLPITREIDLENYPKAIKCCHQELKNKSKYQSWCYRTLAELYLQTGDYTHAQKIYEDILGRREIIWARMGLGKTFLGQTQFDNAKACFEQIIEQHPDQVEAYDYLAEVHHQMGRNKEAQKTLEKAVAISPRVIPRQQQLGELCQLNQDVSAAADAYRAVVRFGNNSIYEKSDDYLNLGRCLSDLSEGDSSKQGKAYAKEALNVLAKAAKRYDNDDSLKLNSLIIETRVHAGQSNDRASAESFAKAQAMASKTELDIQTSLEMAKTLYRMDKSDDAETLLHQLAEKYGDDKSVMAQIEDLLDEPVSLQKKVKARELNRKGITLFEKGDLQNAITTFKEALSETPKHPALNLNLVQVMLKAIESEAHPEWHREMKQALENVKHIPSQHRQYKRFQHLLQRVNALS